MNEFVEQLEVLKRIYTELPENKLPEALDLMDQYLEQMSQSVVFVPDEQVECLVNRGQSEVNDYLEGCSTSAHLMPLPCPSFSPDFDPQQPILYCFTCGDSFNNRKSLYRHGKTTNHRTRERKYVRKEIRKSPETLQTTAIELTDIFSFINEDNNGKEEKFSCFECRRVFGNRKALYRHGQRSAHKTRRKRASPTKGSAISCSLCSFQTANEANLKRHLQRSHPSSKTSLKLAENEKLEILVN